MARPLWVRVRDPKTGHEFDRRTDDPAVVSGRFVVVKPKQYPPVAQPRRTKHHLNLAGLSASRVPAADVSSPETTEATEKENENGRRS